MESRLDEFRKESSGTMYLNLMQSGFIVCGECKLYFI